MIIALKAFNSYKKLCDSLSLKLLFKELLSDDTTDYYLLLHRLYAKYIKEKDKIKTINILKMKAKNISEENKNLLYALTISCEKGLKYVELSYKTFGEYDPIRFVILDEPYCTLSDNIPLEDYDNNEGEPFWMRPEYILEHYSQTCGNYKYK